MADERLLARRFHAQRPRLIAIARKLVRSSAEAEDVVQEAWMRLQRIEADRLDDLDAWLTTTVSRLGLDVVRSARHRRDRSWSVADWPEPESTTGIPESEAIRNELVGAALLAVLDALTPGQRLALILHDVFGLTFAEVAEMTGTSADAARQVASRARRRVRDADPAIAGHDLARARHLVDAWLLAVRAGDIDALLDLLDEGAVLRADDGSRRQLIRGARGIADSAARMHRVAAHLAPVLIDGEPGAAAIAHDRIVSLMSIQIRDGRILRLDVLADPGRISALSGAESLAVRPITASRSP